MNLVIEIIARVLFGLVGAMFAYVGLTLLFVIGEGLHILMHEDWFPAVVLAICSVAAGAVAAGTKVTTA